MYGVHLWVCVVSRGGSCALNDNTDYMHYNEKSVLWSCTLLGPWACALSVYGLHVWGPWQVIL